MSLIYATEDLDQCWDEIYALGKAHWHETMEYYRGHQEFNPQFERYNAYAKAGWLILFTVRDEGRMVGYGLMYVVPSMHTQELIGTEDTMFLLPEYRRGRNGLRLYEFVEKEMERRGVREILVTAKPGTAACRILEHLSCNLINYQYSKQLGSADSAVINNAVMEETPNVRSEVLTSHS